MTQMIGKNCCWRLEKNIYERRCLEIDPEGGQGPAWTVEPVEREFIISDIEKNE